MQKQFERLHEIRLMIFGRRWQVATREIETIDNPVKLIKRNKINLYAIYLIEKKKLPRATSILRDLNQDISGTPSCGISLGLLSYLEYILQNKFESEESCIKAISLLETMGKTAHKGHFVHLYCELFLSVCYIIMAHICCINTEFKRAYDYLIKTKQTVFNRFKDDVDVLIQVVEQIYTYKLAFGGVREESFRNIQNYEVITRRLEQLAKYHHEPDESKGAQLYIQFDRRTKALVQLLYKFTFEIEKPRKGSFTDNHPLTERLPSIHRINKKQSISVNKKKDIKAVYAQEDKKEDVKKEEPKKQDVKHRSESQPRLGNKKSVRLASGVTLSKKMEKKLAIYDIITNPLFQGLADEFKKKKPNKKQIKKPETPEQISPILPMNSIINIQQNPKNKPVAQQKIDEVKEDSVIRHIEEEISENSNESDIVPFPELNRGISRNANMNIVPMFDRVNRGVSQDAPKQPTGQRLNRSNTLVHDQPNRFGTQPDDNKFMIRLMSQECIQQEIAPPMNDAKSAKDNQVTSVKDYLKIPLQRMKSMYYESEGQRQVNASVLQPAEDAPAEEIKPDEEGTKSEIAYKKQLSLDTTINNELIRSLNICLHGQKHTYKVQYNHAKAGAQNCSQIMQLFLNDCRTLDDNRKGVVSAFLWLLNECIRENMGETYAENNDASSIPLLANKLLDTHQKFLSVFPASVQLIIDLTEAFFIWLYRKKFTKHLVREILQ